MCSSDLDEQGMPVQAMGILAVPAAKGGAADASPPATAATAAGAQAGRIAGKACPECGNHTLIQKDGCEFCTACGFVGQCG